MRREFSTSTTREALAGGFVVVLIAGVLLAKNPQPNTREVWERYAKEVVGNVPDDLREEDLP